MAERVRKRRESRPKEAEAEDVAPVESKTEAHDRQVAEIDELLDEIDAVLEDVEFVAAFVQKGGE